MQNVEFKAELRDRALAVGVLGRLGAAHVGELHQTDTYYRVPDGRLKKRECAGEPTEYIFYHRANRLRPKLSHFTIYSEHDALKRFGTLPLPVWVIVEKVRDLWMYKSVRVHLDRVHHLGEFVEIEALVSPANHVGQCHIAVGELRAALGPAVGEPLATSYADLIALECETAEG